MQCLAIWLLAVLGLSLPAEDHSETGLGLCRHCFYRKTPPQGPSAGPLLRPLCHRLPGGQAFATVSRQASVYSAFHLSRGWTEREGEEGPEPVTEEEADTSSPAAPALLRGGGSPSPPVSPPDLLVQRWDTTVAALVRSSIAPRCSSLEGDLYILTGAGDLRAAGAGDEERQTDLLWSAACCAVPEGKAGFSLGLVGGPGEAVRQVSVKELQETLGAAELFSEGCGGTHEEAAGVTVDLHRGELQGDPEEPVEEPNPTRSTDGNLVYDSNASGQRTAEEKVGSEAASEEPKEDVKESKEAPIGGEQVAGAGAQPEGADAADRTQEPSADETLDDANSSSILVYILSTTVSVLKAPLRPVFSTVTQLPGQVTYVLQEDLGVLAALPGETFSMFHLLTSDLLSWMGLAADMLLGIGETCFFGVYDCSSCMMGVLINSCYTGVTGMGTLVGDSAGIVGDALGNGWWATKFFGGRLWEQSEGYVGTVMSEMGGQAKAVGGGFGKLAQRSGNGLVNVFKMGGGLIMGTVDMAIGAVSEAFGQESEN